MKEEKETSIRILQLTSV